MRTFFKTFFVLVASFFLITSSTSTIEAQSNQEIILVAPTATESATNSASTAAETVSNPIEVRRPDITLPTVPEQNPWQTFLAEHPLEPISWKNFFQHGIRSAIATDVQPNIIVLLLLFPIITSIISASRHLIGLQGFGIYAPAVLSVAFVSTGVSIGLILFFIILLSALLFRKLLKKLRLQYLPRTAMLLWGVSLAILGFLIVPSLFGFSPLLQVSIFPLLIIMLLTENFLETQLMSSQSQAFRLTLETVFIALLCSLLISAEFVQQFVILNPEITLLSVAIFNIVVGRYSGLRLLEYIRFNSIIEK